MSSAVSPPVAVSVDDVASFSHDVDVLVIGFGMAGGCAAVSAAAAGASVLVLERAAAAGGTTALEGGDFYLGGGTPVQEATGNPDSPQEMYNYLVAVSPDPDHAKIRAYCEGSVEHFHWLEGLGFQFERSYYPGKAEIQPHAEGLMYTGNEQVWPFMDRAVPAPRGHKLPVAADTGGGAIVVNLLVRRAEELGVRVRYDTEVTNLVTDGDTVVGASWRRFGELGTVRAKSVIIAAGGFIKNEAMVAQHMPRFSSLPLALGTAYDDGLGIRMGLSVGGAVRHMDKMFLTAPPYPPEILLTGIIVNRYGYRFVAEDSYHARTAAFVMDQPDCAAYLLVDAAHLQVPRLPLVPLIALWDKVTDLEQALDIPPGNLAYALDCYNRFATEGHDPEFHKQPRFLAAQDQGPWAAFDLSLDQAIYEGFTLGGLTTSSDGRVLREDRTPVAGLYAVGASASGIAIDGKGYSTGIRLGEGSFFGRRAGVHAASSIAALQGI